MTGSDVVIDGGQSQTPLRSAYERVYAEVGIQADGVGYTTY